MSSTLALWSSHSLRADGARVTLRVAPGLDTLEPVLARWIEDGVDTLPVFRRSRYASVHRVKPGDTAPPVFLKQFLLRGPSDRIKRYFRRSRARRTLAANVLIEELGFRTEQIIALAEFRRFASLSKSLLVTREIPDVNEARSVFRDPEFGLRSDINRRRRLLERLGREIGAWHGAGLYHGDLRLSNVLMQIEGDDCTFYWMDNERTRRYARLPRARRAHNLMQIIMDPGVFSRTDMMRLWRTYQSVCGFAPEDEKQFLRSVIDRTRKRWKSRNWL